jgi:hypothetical protein
LRKVACLLLLLLLLLLLYHRDPVSSHPCAHPRARSTLPLVSPRARTRHNLFLLLARVAVSPGEQKAIVRLAPTLHARRGLWSAGFMRVLKIDEFTENDQRLFTQPLALARLGRYLIDMHQVGVLPPPHTHEE